MHSIFTNLLICHLYVFFNEVPVRASGSFFNWLVVFFLSSGLAKFLHLLIWKKRDESLPRCWEAWTRPAACRGAWRGKWERPGDESSPIIINPVKQHLHFTNHEALCTAPGGRFEDAYDPRVGRKCALKFHFLQDAAEGSIAPHFSGDHPPCFPVITNCEFRKV